MSTLTAGLRLALDQLEAMVASFGSPHPIPQWRQQLVWQDAERELRRAGFSPDLAGLALEIYDREREAARIEVSATNHTEEKR